MSPSMSEGKQQPRESPLRRLVACGMAGPAVGIPLSKNSISKPGSKRLNIMSTLLGNCGICTMPDLKEGYGSMSMSSQFVELHGLRFIGLGAVVDELTPKERVYDTLEQLTTRSERMISVGYLIDIPAVMAENHYKQSGSIKVAETLPLDVWTTNYPNKANMSVYVSNIVNDTKQKRFPALIENFSRAFASQMANTNFGINKYLAGITAHNLGVVNVLVGQPENAIIYFKKAIHLKEIAFGKNNPEVALSCDELGIQFFAKGDFEGALSCFKEAHAVRNHLPDACRRPQQAMVLNNMACCYFQLGDHKKALTLLEEADGIQQRAIGSSAQPDLDLLHVATVICNCGYLKLALKNYDEARSLFEEALLIQGSVLDDGHRAVRDTLSNFEVANAFHM